MESLASAAELSAKLIDESLHAVNEVLDRLGDGRWSDVEAETLWDALTARDQLTTAQRSIARLLERL